MLPEHPDLRWRHLRLGALRTGLAGWSSVKRVTSAEPAQFREAVAAMNATTVRPEIELGPIRPPQRLAPFSYALGAEVRHPETAIVPSGPRATRSAG